MHAGELNWDFQLCLEKIKRLLERKHRWEGILTIERVKRAHLFCLPRKVRIDSGMSSHPFKCDFHIDDRMSDVSKTCFSQLLRSLCSGPAPARS